MRFEIKRTGGCFPHIDLYFGDYRILRIFCSDTPDGFDPDRMVRLIEKAPMFEKILNAILHHHSGGSLPAHMINCFNDYEKLINYTKHGEPKEEMVVVGVFPGMKVGDSTSVCAGKTIQVYEIPLSKAIKAGIVKK